MFDPSDDQRGTYPKPRKKADGTLETFSEFLERAAAELYGLPPSATRKKTWQELQQEQPFEERLNRIFAGEPGMEG